MTRPLVLQPTAVFSIVLTWIGLLVTAFVLGVRAVG